MLSILMPSPISQPLMSIAVLPLLNISTHSLSDSSAGGLAIISLMTIFADAVGSMTMIISMYLISIKKSGELFRAMIIITETSLSVAEVIQGLLFFFRHPEVQIEIMQLI